MSRIPKTMRRNNRIEHIRVGADPSDCSAWITLRGTAVQVSARGLEELTRKLRKLGFGVAAIDNAMGDIVYA